MCISFQFGQIYREICHNLGFEYNHNIFLGGKGGNGGGILKTQKKERTA